MPMAASARSQSTPPWMVPSGLACCGPASISITTRPGSTEPMVKPISIATGGGGSSPRCTLRIISSIFATRFLLSPRAGPDGRGYGQPEHEQGGGHGGEDPPQPQAEPVARHPPAGRGHEQAQEPRGERPAEAARSLGGKVQREPKAEKAIARPHRPEIGDAHGLRLWIRREQAQPDP